MANELFLDSFSQQGESIELRQRAMAHCNESSTLPLLTMGENLILEKTQDTLIGEHMIDVLWLIDEQVTVPTIVTVEEPSQVKEGMTDSQRPIITESNVMPLPGGTFLAPIQEVSTTFGEVERQSLDKSSSDESREILMQVHLIREPNN